MIQNLGDRICDTLSTKAAFDTLQLGVIGLAPGVAEFRETEAIKNGSDLGEILARDVKHSRNALYCGVALIAISLVGAAFGAGPVPLTSRCFWIGGTLAATGGMKLIDTLFSLHKIHEKFRKDHPNFAHFPL
jgi:hypothetical protein